MALKLRRTRRRHRLESLVIHQGTRLRVRRSSLSRNVGKKRLVVASEGLGEHRGERCQTSSFFAAFFPVQDPALTTSARGTPRTVISTDGAGVAEPSVARVTASSAGENALVSLRPRPKTLFGTSDPFERSTKRVASFTLLLSVGGEEVRRAPRARGESIGVRLAALLLRQARARGAREARDTRRTRNKTVFPFGRRFPQREARVAQLGDFFCVSAIFTSNARALASIAEAHVAQCAWNAARTSSVAATRANDEDACVESARDKTSISDKAERSWFFWSSFRRVDADESAISSAESFLF